MFDITDDPELEEACYELGINPDHFIDDIVGLEQEIEYRLNCERKYEELNVLDYINSRL